MTTKLYPYLAIAILVFCALVPLLLHVAKRQGNKTAENLGAVISGLAAATVYLWLCTRTMFQTGDAVPIVLLNLALLLLGGVVSGARVLRQSKARHKGESLGSGRRYAAVLLFLVLYAAVSTFAFLAFAHSQAMTTALEAGLFVVNHLVFLFPLAAAGVVFAKARQR